MRYEILDREIKLKSGPQWRRQLFGRQMRLKAIANSVNDLIREERVHISYFRGWEVRNYTERVGTYSKTFNLLSTNREYLCF